MWSLTLFLAQSALLWSLPVLGRVPGGPAPGAPHVARGVRRERKPGRGRGLLQMLIPLFWIGTRALKLSLSPSFLLIFVLFGRAQATEAVKGEGESVADSLLSAEPDVGLGHTHSGPKAPASARGLAFAAEAVLPPSVRVPVT